MRFVDVNGNEQPPEWAVAAFGPQDVYIPSALPAFRLIELRQRIVPAGKEHRDDPKELQVRVLDADGAPRSGISVGVGGRDVNVGRQVIVTGADGLARFDITGSWAGYSDWGHLAVGFPSDNGDVYNNAGWKMAPGGPKSWLNPTFQLVVAETPVEPPVDPPEPTVDQFDMVLAKLDQIITLLESITA